MIAYHAFGADLLAQVLELYRNAGWSAYLRDDEKLTRAFQNSLYLLGAFDGEKLVGFIRCVGDGEHIVYAQDLIVSADYRRQGIGTELLRRALEEYQHVRAFLLTTDAADQRANGFYTARKMKAYGEAGLAGYIRQDADCVPERNCIEDT